MTETAIHEELQNIIEKSVDQSVDRAFKKYGKISRRPRFSLRGLISLLVLLALIGTGVYVYQRSQACDAVETV